MNEENKKTVLLIEDDPLLLDLYEKKFIAEGFSVIKTTDGEGGLKSAFTSHPGTIVLDSGVFSDLDFLTKLREDNWGKNVNVIVLCNASGEEEAKKTMSQGVKEYLIKENITPSELVAKVKTYIN